MNDCANYSFTHAIRQALEASIGAEFGNVARKMEQARALTAPTDMRVQSLSLRDND